MKKSILPPLLAVLAGSVGFLLRKRELKEAFEPATGLPLSAAAGVTLALAGLTAAVTVLLIVLCRREKASLPYDTAFDAQGNLLYLVVCVLAAFLLLGSAGAEIVTYPITFRSYQNALLAEQGRPELLPVFLPPLRMLLCALGFVCTLAVARNLYWGRGKGKEHLPLLGLCLLFCVWLVSDYQIRASDPAVLDYIYEVLAICTSLLGLYEIATYSFQEGKPRRTAVLCLLGTYFSLVTLADTHTLAELLRYGFCILFLTAHTALLLGGHPAGQIRPAETETEA